MSRRRSIIRFVIVGIFLLAGWVLFEAIRVSSADPVIAVDHLAAIRTRAIAMSGVDPDAGAEAWEALLRAFDVHEAVSAEIIERAQADGERPRGPWDVGLLDYSILLAGDSIPEMADRELRALTLFDERGGDDELAAFARATTAIGPPLVLLPGTRLPDALLTELARARAMARTLAARMRVAHADGDPAAVAASFDQLLAIARAMSFEPGLIGHLVGQAIQALAVGELNHELVENESSEALCRRLLATLDARKLAPIELAIEAERALFHDMVQSFFTDDGAGDGLLAEDNIAGAAIARFFGPRRARVLALADEYFDGYVNTSRLPVAQRQTQGFDRSAFLGGLGFSASNRFARNLLSDLDRALSQIDISRSQVESARLLLAIEIHQRRHGAPPARLEDLAPGILPSVPVDPIHGGPYGYKRVETRPGDTGFVLYSYGVDGVDDGGKISEMGPWKGYQEDGAGYDVQINAPRQDWPTDP